VEKSIEVLLNHHTVDSTLTTLQLREVWADLVSQSSRQDGRLRLDVYNWLNKVALDIIGSAGNSIATDPLLAKFITHFEWHTGFNCTFNSLHSRDATQNPVYAAFCSILTDHICTPIFTIQLLFPIFRCIICIPLFLTKTPCRGLSSAANGPLPHSRSCIQSYRSYWVSDY
jgi:hypothetical protein